MRWIETHLCILLCVRLTDSLLDQGYTSEGRMDHIVVDMQKNFTRFQHEMELQLSLLRLKHANDILVQNQTIMNQNMQIQEMQQRQREMNMSLIQQKYESILKIVMEQNETINTQREEIKELEKQKEETFTNMSVLQNWYEMLLKSKNETIAEQQQKIVLEIERTQRRNISDVENTCKSFEQKVTKTVLAIVAGLEKHRDQKMSELEGRLNQTFSTYELILRDVMDKENNHFVLYSGQISRLNQNVTYLVDQFHNLSQAAKDDETQIRLLKATLIRK